MPDNDVPSPAPPTSRLVLRVEAGPDRGLEYPMGGSEFTIGRGQDCDLRLTDAAVSRRHLTLRVDQDKSDRAVVHILATTGTNPVWTIDRGQRREIIPGEAFGVGHHLTLGNTTLTIGEPALEFSPRPIARSQGATVELDARPTPTSRGATRLTALAALGDNLARCGSLQAVFRRTTEWAVTALEATRAVVLTPDGEDILAATGTTSLADVAVSRTLLSRVLREQRAFLVRDVHADPELAERRSVQIRDIRGAMVAPASGLVLYVEWDGQTKHVPRDADALSLLVCAAQLVAATGASARERQELRAATHRDSRSAPPRLVGSSAPMQQLQVFLEKVAASPATVLVQGESGTGKELVASLVHTLSPRSDKPLVCLNCAAIPESLLESELFGHEKGAFTGAVASHQGVFERAHTGTLFLDEIGEMTLSAQVRLLRVLETRRLTRVGGHKDIDVDVRLVTATHRDLEQMVARSEFREDLYYRIKVLQTRLPALRERPDDITELVEHFLSSLGETMGRRVDHISDAAAAALSRYPWPGNVRELRNVVERALVLGHGPVLDVDELPPELLAARGPAASGRPATEASVVPLADLEREAVVQALAATSGNKARAAALLGIDRSTLYRKLKDLGVGD